MIVQDAGIQFGEVSHEAAIEKAYKEYEADRVKQSNQPTEVEKHLLPQKKG
jgi:hypothetical protein